MGTLPGRIQRGLGTLGRRRRGGPGLRAPRTGRRLAPAPADRGWLVVRVQISGGPHAPRAPHAHRRKECEQLIGADERRRTTARHVQGGAAKRVSRMTRSRSVPEANDERVHGVSIPGAACASLKARLRRRERRCLDRDLLHPGDVRAVGPSCLAVPPGRLVQRDEGEVHLLVVGIFLERA